MEVQVAIRWIVGALVLSYSVEGKTLGEPRVDSKPVTLEDVLESKYSAAGYNGVWISDNELEYRREGNVFVHNVGNNEDELVLNGSLFDRFEGPRLSFSPDRRFVLITHDVEQVWRHSKMAFYDIYDTKEDTFESVIPPLSTEQPKLSLFQWASGKSNAFVFIHNNNIYYRTSAVKPIPPALAQYKQLTTDGTEKGPIFNGHSDWVYEEEMFGSATALWFSKDSTHLAFIKFDDRDVEKFMYPMYGEPGDRNTVYPKWIDIFYPKPGTENPKVGLYLVKLSEDKPQPEPFQYETSNDPDGNRHYIARTKWLSSTHILLVHLNRLQNHATYYVCDTGTKICKLRLTEESETGWVDVYDPLVSSNGEEILTLMFVNVVAKSTYKHIVKININNAQPAKIVEVTNEHFTVSSILAWDETKNMVYFITSGVLFDNDPTPLSSPDHVYSIKIGTTPTNASCMTCQFSNSDGELCKANGASFSHAYTYFIHTCSGPGIPEVQLRENNGDYILREKLQENTDLRSLLADVSLPKQLDYSVYIESTEAQINIRLYVPPEFDETAEIKYPLLIDVYGGPGSQQINDRYGVGWSTSLVTDKKIIYGYIDGRGSAGQSMEVLHAIYRKLGNVEIRDQIDATRWLIYNKNFIDKDQVGIWGWSYGGYATSMVLSNDTENIFKCGIAVAPVTSWLYYDTIYTERFMGLPTDEDNWEGYKTSQVVTQVEGFRNKEFLLVHGNADDNVHYQQSMLLARALEKADIMFDQLSYPDEAHGITGVRNHLYHSFEKFLFRNCLRPEVIPEATTPSGSLQMGPFLILVVTGLGIVSSQLRTM